MHTNSGIPNHAFHDLAAGRSAATPGRRPGRIWYETLRDARLQGRTRTSSPSPASRVVTARRLYGADSGEVAAVQDAWQGVGIAVS